MKKEPEEIWTENEISNPKCIHNMWIAYGHNAKNLGGAYFLQTKKYC